MKARASIIYPFNDTIRVDNLLPLIIRYNTHTTFHIFLAVSNRSISGLLGPSSRSFLSSTPSTPSIPSAPTLKSSPNLFSLPSSIGVASPTLFNVTMLAFIPSPCIGKPNLKGNAFPFLAGLLRDAVPAIASSGAEDGFSIAGGEGSGEAVVDGSEGEGSLGPEVGERRVGSWEMGGWRVVGSWGWVLWVSCRWCRSSEVGVCSLGSGSDWPV